MDDVKNKVIVDMDTINLVESGKYPKDVVVWGRDEDGILRPKTMRKLIKTKKGGILLN